MGCCSEGTSLRPVDRCQHRRPHVSEFVVIAVVQVPARHVEGAVIVAQLGVNRKVSSSLAHLITSEQIEKGL